ncbi:hypothetical protein EBT31_06720 [bacterium]|nr:hypothetical protein [bacterium]NBX49405.1 hypothetical protein [bacterium]
MKFEHAFIQHCKYYAPKSMRIAIFIVFFWFGILKVLSLSPAEALVQNLFEQTIPFMEFPTFLILFGALEMLIGILFLIPKATRIVIPLLGLHMATTALPLIILPEVSWSAPFVPTLVGQYIVKNVVIIAGAISIAGSMQIKQKTSS